MKFKKISDSKAREILADCNPNPLIIQGRYYAAIEDGVIKGCVGILRRSWYLTELRHLYVKPEFRRKGIGTSLVSFSLEKIKTPFVCCTIVQHNEASINLFKKLGFRVEGRFTNPSTGNRIVLLMRFRD